MVTLISWRACRVQVGSEVDGGERQRPSGDAEDGAQPRARRGRHAAGGLCRRRGQAARPGFQLPHDG
jgi:hypothetical protein